MLRLPGEGDRQGAAAAGGGRERQGHLPRPGAGVRGRTTPAASACRTIGERPLRDGRPAGKLLNVCYDLPSRRLEDSGDFKAIVSGEPIRAQRKNEPAFDFEPYCRLLFSANNLPESDDVSHGYFRRWYIVPFDGQTSRRATRPAPAGEIVAETPAAQRVERPAEPGAALDAPVPGRGASRETSPSMDEAIEEFMAILDPFPAVAAGSRAGGRAQGWVETAANDRGATGSGASGGGGGSPSAPRRWGRRSGGVPERASATAGARRAGRGRRRGVSRQAAVGLAMG